MARVTIIGRVGTDPETSKSPSGKDLAKFRLAESIWNRDTREEETKWYTVSAWEQLAQIVGEEIRKGMRIYVTGDTSEYAGTSGTIFQLNAREVGAADRFVVGAGGTEW
jgi:single stranded DNA-binding protein